MNDQSDAVASHVVIRPLDAPMLCMRPRAPFVGVLLFGSWGNLLALPTTIMLVTEETPARALPVAVTIAALGYGLLYAAARCVVNRAKLRVDHTALHFSFSLWPFRARCWPLPEVRKVTIPTRTPSFLHPATYRGYPMAQPHLVVLHLDTATGQGTATLPVTLGLQDAEAVARFVARHR